MQQPFINSLFYKIEQTSRICHYFCESCFKEYLQKEISFDEFIILDTILCNPDICQRDLAKRILKGASHISKILNALEKRELIERPIGKKGKRTIRKIVITENGINLHAFASQIALDFASKIDVSIGITDSKKCANYLDKIIDKVKDDQEIILE